MVAAECFRRPNNRFNLRGKSNTHAFCGGHALKRGSILAQVYAQNIFRYFTRGRLRVPIRVSALRYKPDPTTPRTQSHGRRRNIQGINELKN